MSDGDAAVSTADAPFRSWDPMSPFELASPSAATSTPPPTTRRPSILNAISPTATSSFVTRAGSSTKGKAKAGDEMEMIQFSTALGSGPGPGHPVLERQKTDDALAKWRKWVVENPPGSAESSPLTTKVSTLPNPSSVSPPPSAHSAYPPTTSVPLQSPSDTVAESSNAAAGPISPPLFDIYNTESIRILRDVELAIDPNYASRQSTLLSPLGGPSRRMSNMPRLSTHDNPFESIAGRLSSRRVRPIVLELIHALGHYIDALWTLRRPNERCTWITDPTAPRPLPGSAMEGRKWTSKTITAVQEGKTLGYVTVPPGDKDLEYWREEVRFALADVTSIVGIMKGVGWAFTKAMKKGEYGVVEDQNVLGPKGEGGNVVRLLNDLEEALWGDAPPRSTDLAYELPLDFDPFDLPSAEEISGLHRVADAPTPVLAFLSNSSSRHSEIVASPDAQSIDQMPDLVHIASPAMSPLTSPLHEPETPKGGGRAGSGDGSYWGFKNSTGESWEEIGKRRHAEWLASRQATGASASSATG